MLQSVLNRSARIFLDSCAGFALCVLSSSPGMAQEAETPESVEITHEQAREQLLEHLATYGWEAGPNVFLLGQQAEIQLPAEYSFLDGDESRNLMEFYENIPTDQELGLVARTDDLAGWFVIFEFDDIGYVEDDEKDEIDADAILDSYREGTRLGNEERAKRGIPGLDLIGWRTAPRYNDQTQNLEWCLHFESGGSPVFNHNIRILGRLGVMKVTLVCGPEELDAGLAETQTILAGFSYSDGQKYSQFRSGDRVAEYGLAALVAGGTIAAIATKGKIFGKILKPLIIGVCALGAFFARSFRSIFGRKKDDGFPDRTE